MALFPFFINIENAHGIIIGTGKHAVEKIERLINLLPQYSIEGLLFSRIIYNIPSILNKTIHTASILFLKLNYYTTN